MTTHQLPKAGEKWQNTNPTTGDVLNVTVIKIMGGDAPSVLYKGSDAHVGRIPLTVFFRAFRKVQ